MKKNKEFGSSDFLFFPIILIICQLKQINKK